MCLEGASRAGAELLAAIPDAGLRLYYAWTPMLPPDSEDAARQAAERLAEPRAAHYWDSERRLGRRVGQALGITARESLGAGEGPGFAWDVYLVYGRGKRTLEAPDFWMHQLALTRAPRLDAEAWRERVGALLAPS